MTLEHYADRSSNFGSGDRLHILPQMLTVFLCLFFFSFGLFFSFILSANLFF
jgi:hypothetical protein